MRRIDNNPVGALASWLRQNEDIPGVTEALNVYKKKFRFDDAEFKHASSLKQQAELSQGMKAGMRRLEPGMYYKENTQIVYKLEKSGKGCSWRPHDRDWWSKNGDIVKLTVDFNAGKVVVLTMELASKLGLEAGMCIVCGKALTTAKSKELGIGPVCIKTLGQENE